MDLVLETCRLCGQVDTDTLHFFGGSEDPLKHMYAWAPLLPDAFHRWESIYKKEQNVERMDGRMDHQTYVLLQSF